MGTLAFTLSETGNQGSVLSRGVIRSYFCFQRITVSAVWRIDQIKTRPGAGTGGDRSNPREMAARTRVIVLEVVQSG